jgi:hypothetical protein
MRTSIVVAAAALLVALNACSDDDGANVLPNGPPGVGGGGSGGSAGGGAGGTGGGGTGGTAGAGGSGVGGSGGAAGCSVTPPPDAGSDAGALDAGPDGTAVDGGDPDASGTPGVVSFAGDIHPLFAAKCGPCHVTDFSGGHNVGGELTQAYADAVTISARLVQRIDGGGMPPSDAPPPNDCGAEGRGDQPGDEGCLSVDEVALVQSWIDQCYPR